MSNFLYFSQISKLDKSPPNISRCSKCDIFTWQRDNFVCRKCLKQILHDTFYEKGIANIIEKLMVDESHLT